VQQQEVQVQYQLQVLEQVVELAQAKALVVQEAVPLGWGLAQVKVEILVQELARLREQVQQVRVVLAEELVLLQEQEAQAEVLVQAQELELALAREQAQQAQEGQEQAVERVRAEAAEWAVAQVLKEMAAERE